MINPVTNPVFTDEQLEHLIDALEFAYYNDDHDMTKGDFGELWDKLHGATMARSPQIDLLIQ